ncbi:uncharacterized protein PV09_04829 [Verruconis gallopava]|uniref:Rab-GAP TBC domain-containing protein n=1 Tax=Verruconis gallopava TaxID=253628 RepID=A0A0D1YTP9_9PEZI|nr:uncharacterized protein PV09_04829 [Verruconis gallopava]KIW04002.1 hypothetical protein PV09_04829 [Verruconis gallopava]
METPELKAQPDDAESTQSTPRRRVGSASAATDSLVTIPLSDSSQSRPPTVNVEGDQLLSKPPRDSLSPTDDCRSSRSSERSVDGRRSTRSSSHPLTLAEEIANSPERKLSMLVEGKRKRSSSSASESSLQVDWEQLDKTEAREEEQAEDDQQTALLLARLEQENNALAVNPKAARARVDTQSRPPSVHQLKKMVQEQGARSVRFSLVPAVAPMTELEFWAALVRDYAGTAQRLPLITSSKIRGGIPPPLRGVVWVSMAAARNTVVEEQFDRLCLESTPHENTIAKDIGRSFPGVDMFKDPNGDGQRMLGTVLRCFSLYDDKIGYCQGLGFLVGPLLMNMGDKQAFCVLVRLMEDYDLRSCFLPDLSGLHLRIFQFKKLLAQHVPAVAQHLDDLGVEGTAYSQWFLSFFAVTCPLALLFRIYDVIFAEGASETIMRVALAVIRKNEKKLLAFTELEDAMRLLLSRQLWDPYGLGPTSGDDLVNDFCDFTADVTRDSLQAIEAEFRRAESGETSGRGFFPDVQSAASRFLGRLWAPSHTHTPSKANILTSTLAAPTPSRPASGLHRTPSKQSLATLGSNDGGSDSSSSQSVSTAMTELSRDSSADFASMKSIKSPDSSTGSRSTMASQKDKDLHNQIEDLLMACTELQREQNLLTAQLQKEKEDRQEDHAVFRSLVDYLKDNFTEDEEPSPVEPETPLEEDPIRDMMSEVTRLVSQVETRIQPNNRRSSGYETKASLRASMAALRDQLQNESLRSQELAREIQAKDEEIARMKDDLQKARMRIQSGYSEKQRLEKTISELRQAARSGRSRSGSQPGVQPSSDISTPPSRSDTGASDVSVSSTGLREFKLAQSLSNRSSSQVASSPPTYSKRVSSLSTQAVLSTADHAPPDQDTLLLELVNAKTAEAVAKQELEELKARFEAMRKMLNVTPPIPQLSVPVASATTAAETPLSKVSSRSSESTSSTPKSSTPISITKSPDSSTATSATPGVAATAGSWGAAAGGFFGWGKRSLSSAQVPTITKK